jgi:hypothetical protein
LHIGLLGQSLLDVHCTQACRLGSHFVATPFLQSLSLAQPKPHVCSAGEQTWFLPQSEVWPHCTQLPSMQTDFA